MRVREIDVRVIGQNVDLDCAVLGRLGNVPNRNRAIVGADHAHRHRRGRGRTVVVRHGVGELNLGSLARGKVLIRGAGVIDHNVADHHRLTQPLAYYDFVNRMRVREIDVRVIGQNIDLDCAVLGRLGNVPNRNWPIVGTGHSERQGRGRGRTVVVRHGVIDDNRRAFADREVIEVGPRLPMQLVVDNGCRALTRGHTDGIDRMSVRLIDIGVVGENVNSDRRVLIRRRRIDVSHRPVVGAGQCESQLRRRGNAIAALYGVGNNNR